jgi:fimbrial chaperone protein
MIRGRAGVLVLGAAVLAAWLLAAGAAVAQSLTVQPVSLQLGPGQMTATLSVTNGGDNPTGIQIRAFAWSQPNGKDELTATPAILASPPLTTLVPNSTQVVRLLLRQAPRGREATYRLLLDQIPSATPSAPTTVTVTLRLSIPIFVEPQPVAPAHLDFHVELSGGQAYLVAANDGGRHDAVRDISLVAGDGRPLKTENGSAYVLSGVTRRWRIMTQGRPPPGGTWHLSAHLESGDIDQPVPVVAIP